MASANFVKGLWLLRGIFIEENRYEPHMDRLLMIVKIILTVAVVVQNIICIF